MSYVDDHPGEWMARVEEFRWICVYCGNGLTLDTKPQLVSPFWEHALAPDHVIPRSRGGVDELWNIVPACVRCNLLKGDWLAQEFILQRPGLCKYAKTINRYLFYLGPRPKLRKKQADSFAQSTTRELGRKMPSVENRLGDWYIERRHELKQQTIRLLGRPRKAG